MLTYSPSEAFISSFSQALRELRGVPLPVEQLSDERLDYICENLPAHLWRVKGYVPSCFAERRERRKLKNWF